MEHLSAALAGLESEQTEHIHVPVSSLGGGGRPAADQSKLFNGAVGAAATTGVEEVGERVDAGEGEEEFVGSCRGASQTVHFSFASAGFCREQSEQVHVCATVVGAFIPAAVQLKPFIARTDAITGVNSYIGREVTAKESTLLRAADKLGPAGEEEVVPTENVYLGSSSTFIARASSFGDSLAFAWATVFSGMACDSTGGSAKGDESGGAGMPSAFLISTLSARKLYRSLEGSFGAEVFKPPNTDLVTEGGDSITGGGGAGLSLMWALSSAGSIISAGRTIALEGLASSISWT